MTIYEKKLRKTCEIIDACFTLKEAFYKIEYPELTDKEIKMKIYDEILKRKEEQWTYQTS